MTALPTPRRTLRNEIARHLMEDRVYGTPLRSELRDCLDDAAVAVEALRNYVLVFGPQALIEAL